MARPDGLEPPTTWFEARYSFWTGGMMARDGPIREADQDSEAVRTTRGRESACADSSQVLTRDTSVSVLISLANMCLFPGTYTQKLHRANLAATPTFLPFKRGNQPQRDHTELCDSSICRMKAGIPVRLNRR